MLEIIVKASEQWDEDKQEFYTLQKDTVLKLEHSLLSISKWESKWHTNFIGNEKLTLEQSIDYVRCMTVTPKVNPKIYSVITKENLSEIAEYIKNPMTATVVKQAPDGVRRYGKFHSDNLTSEEIYYYMIEFGVPFECEKWHLNRLLTLLKVCSVKQMQANGKKMPSGQLAKQYAQLNSMRRAARGTKG